MCRLFVAIQQVERVVLGRIEHRRVRGHVVNADLQLWL